jgi:hypothetical protein
MVVGIPMDIEHIVPLVAWAITAVDGAVDCG